MNSDVLTWEDVESDVRRAYEQARRALLQLYRTYGYPNEGLDEAANKLEAAMADMKMVIDAAYETSI